MDILKTVMEKDFLGSPTDENSIHNWTLGKEIFRSLIGEKMFSAGNKIHYLTSMELQEGS